jgi:hypothetical protein
VTNLHVVRADDFLPDAPSPVAIGTDTETHEPVTIAYEARDIGISLVGMQGTGKSTVLERLILADLEHGTPGMVIDPHGTLVQRIIQLATPQQAERIILLEADETVPFGINLLSVRDPVDEEDRPVSWVLDNLVAVFKKLYGGESIYQPRLERYLRLCAKTLIFSGQTLDRALDLFDDPAFLSDCLARISDAHEQRKLRIRWENFAKLRPADQRAESEALINRLESLLDSEIIKKIVGSKETTVPFGQILNSDRLLLVSLPSEQMTDERCNFIGILLLIALADRIFTRKARTTKPPRLHVYIDEVQRFATSTTAKLLEQGRKYGTGLTLAHQNLAQVAESSIRDASTKSGTLIVLRVSKADADILAGNFPIAPRLEWVEERPVTNGTQPVRLPSREPAEDIYIEGHSDPELDLAARTIFKQYTPPFIYSAAPSVTLQNESRPPYNNQLPVINRYDRDMHYPQPQQRDSAPKSAKYSPRPGGQNIPSQAKLEACRVNDLLHVAMTNPRAYDLDVFVDTLLIREHHTSCVTFLNSPYIDDEALMHEVVRPWFLVHISNERALLSGEYIDAFKQADARILTAHERVSSHRTIFWHIHDEISPDIVRERLRWLWILWKGLTIKKNHVLVTSGEVEPKPDIRFITHPGQTYADAINEFANKLVNPPGKFVAQVKQPREYHETKLLPQLTGTADMHQVVLVRRRSQALYRVASVGDIQSPPVAAGSPPAEGAAGPARTPAVSRQPGGGISQPAPPTPLRALPPDEPVPVHADEQVAETVLPADEPPAVRDDARAETPVQEELSLAGDEPDEANDLEQEEPELLQWKQDVQTVLDRLAKADPTLQVVSFTDTECIAEGRSELIVHQHIIRRTRDNTAEMTERFGLRNYFDGKLDYRGTDEVKWIK